MKNIGGEIEFCNEKFYYYSTDTGRSSLRLIFESGFKSKRFLIPDFLCKVIIWVFDEYNIDYSFYHINNDLTIDKNSIKNNNFDVLYVINYFGQKHQNINDFIDINNKIILEDCVFLPFFKKKKEYKHWIGFNSLRKISYLADGSFIQSTERLNDSYIFKTDEVQEFVSLKYQAKKIKYEYIKEKKHTEKAYLDIFQYAEDLIDKKKDINQISGISYNYLSDYLINLTKEYKIRKKNYQYLDKQISRFNIKIYTTLPSHYIIYCNNRDELRNYLFGRNIFLPVHWLKIEGLNNILYENIMSIPIDSRYNTENMGIIAKEINNFFN
jgi:hypothetical protein